MTGLIQKLRVVLIKKLPPFLVYSFIHLWAGRLIYLVNLVITKLATFFLK